MLIAMFNRARSETVHGVSATAVWQALKKKRERARKGGSVSGMSRSSSGHYITRGVACSQQDLPENDELHDRLLFSTTSSRKASNSSSIASDVDHMFRYLVRRLLKDCV